MLIETGGHRSIADLPAYVTAIMDVKCPGSGEAARHDAGNFARLRPHDEVKFVIRDRADYEYARDVVTREALPDASPPCTSRRCTACSTRRRSSAWVLADRLPVRVQLQVHKYIWGADVRGV